MMRNSLILCVVQFDQLPAPPGQLQGHHFKNWPTPNITSYIAHVTS